MTKSASQKVIHTYAIDTNKRRYMVFPLVQNKQTTIVMMFEHSGTLRLFLFFFVERLRFQCYKVCG